MFFTVSLAQRCSWGWAVELGALGVAANRILLS